MAVRRQLGRLCWQRRSRRTSPKERPLASLTCSSAATRSMLRSGDAQGCHQNSHQTVRRPHARQQCGHALLHL